MLTRLLRLVVAVAAAAGSLFFLRYSIRLASVWNTRTGERPAGMYIGAVAFPLLCAGLAFLAVRLLLTAAKRS